MHPEDRATGSIGPAGLPPVALAKRGLPAVALAEAGFALAALLVAIAILSVMMLVALPTWRHQVQREKEIELIFRGEQYARAIGLYQRKLAGAFPPSLDALVEQKFLRKKYKDPITGEDFEPIYGNSPAGMQVMQQRMMEAMRERQATSQMTGGSVRMESRTGPDGRVTMTATVRGGVTGQGEPSTSQTRLVFQSPMGGTETRITPGPGEAGSSGSGSVGPQAGIVGVVSKSTAQAIRLYNGRDRHDQWMFVHVPQPRAGQPVAPGTRPSGSTPTLPRPTPPPGRGGRGQ